MLDLRLNNPGKKIIKIFLELNYVNRMTPILILIYSIYFLIHRSA